MPADLRTTVVAMTRLRCPWTAEEVQALTEIAISGVKRYLTTLVGQQVLIYADGRYTPGPAAAHWRSHPPKRTSPHSQYGNSARYRAQRALWDVLRQRDWEVAKAALGKSDVLSKIPSPSLTSDKAMQGKTSMPPIKQEELAEMGATSLGLMDVDEVAAELSIHPLTVRKMVKDGKIQGIQISPRCLRISRAALESFLTAQMVKVADALDKKA